MPLLVRCAALHGQVTTPPPAPAGTVTAKLIRYGQRIVRKYDADGDGRLSQQEWAAMQGAPRNADLDRDGQITAAEFALYAANYGAGRRIRLSTRGETVPTSNPAGVQQLGAQPPIGQPAGAQPLSTEPGGAPAAAALDTDPQKAAAERRRDLKYFAPLPAGVPGWFVERDRDGDAQLTLAEFSPKLRSTEVAEFKRYDVNGDGLLTPAELSRSTLPQPVARQQTPATVPPSP